MVRMLRVDDSDNVSAIGYDADFAVLYVVFRSTPDREYRYRDVSPMDFVRLVGAQSIGQFIHKYIKSTKRYTTHKREERSVVPAQEDAAQVQPISVVVPSGLDPTKVAPVALPKAPGGADRKRTQEELDREAYEAVTNRAKEKR